MYLKASKRWVGGGLAERRAESVQMCQLWPIGWNRPNRRKKGGGGNAEAVKREGKASCALHLAGHKSACTDLSALWPMLLSALTSVSLTEEQISECLKCVFSGVIVVNVTSIVTL